MYKMIIVDDEQHSREGMKKILHWENYDIEIAAVADSAQAGIEAAKEYKPDIIITDIKMNSMDGLEMLEEIKQFLDCEFIVISGYSVFEYAQRAINADVTNYLLKPVSRVDLEATILKCITNIRKNTAQSMAERLGSGEYMIDMLMNENVSSSGILPFDKYYVYAVKKSMSILENFHDKIEIFEKLSEQVSDVYIFFVDQYELVAVSPGKLNFDFLGEVYVGVSRGEMSDKFSNIYKMAKTALNQSLREKRKLTVFSADTVIYMNDFYNDAFSNIVMMFESGETEQAKNEIVRTYQRARKENILYSDIIVWSEKLFDTILELIKKEENQRRTEEIENKFKELLGDKTVFDFAICNLICELCDVYDADEEDFSVQNKDRKIEEVVNYVDEHFCEDISLKWLAKKFCIEHKYLSKLFKKYVNKGYVEYITQKRMDAAKKMLGEEKLTISEIARSLSYDEPNYFTVVFKRNVGITPREYRVKHFDIKNGERS
ncbi:MAG: response regulator [Clostridiales bacterium]|nr:response regulator [Clostridiales bacterium]